MKVQAFEETPDDVLVGLARDRDQGAFAEIVRRHDRQLRAAARRLVGNNDEIDDVMQQAYLKAYRALARFRGDGALATWLYRITYNVCMDHLRRRRATGWPAGDEADEPVWEGPNPGDVAADRSVVAEALAALNAGHRAVVLLVDGQGFDYAEAGRLLGLPAGTVASRLSRARADLRRALAPALPDAA
jgi:RNA polymerase sigma-70 factor (ECF subfamily)